MDKTSNMVLIYNNDWKQMEYVDEDWSLLCKTLVSMNITDGRGDVKRIWIDVPNQRGVVWTKKYYGSDLAVFRIKENRIYFRSTSRKLGWNWLY